MDELIRKSDLALYEAKAQGRSNYQLFTQEMHESVIQSKKLEDKLRDACDQDAFELYYQPITGTLNNSCVGMEALIRWYDEEEESYISPEQFIPVAEQSDTIIRIGDWVMRQACSQWAEWNQRGLNCGFMSINVSAKEFEQKNIVDKIKHVLEEFNMPAQHLQIELTETAALKDIDECIKKINKVRELGISFAVDDFGTGNSSLNYLRRLPLDTVKIHRSFIQDIVTEPAHAIITESVIRLGNSLDVNVVAEGVEDEQTKKALEKMHCYVMQGYYFNKPQPAEDIEAVLVKKQQSA